MHKTYYIMIVQYTAHTAKASRDIQSNTAVLHNTTCLVQGLITTTRQLATAMDDVQHFKAAAMTSVPCSRRIFEKYRY